LRVKDPMIGPTAISGDTALFTSDDIVYVFERDAVTDAWIDVAQLSAGDGAANFGRSIAIDARTIIAGADGAAYVFRRRARGAPRWRQVARLAPGDGNPLFGAPVDIDGQHAIVGAGDEAAYVFVADDGGARRRTEVAKLESPDPVSCGFGRGVGISGNAAIVGGFAPDNGRGQQPATAYVFGRDQGGPENWGLLRKYGTCSPSESDHPLPANPAGVAIDGDVAMLATTRQQLGAAFSSVSVFQFQHDTQAWGDEEFVGSFGDVIGNPSLSGDRAAFGLFHWARIIGRNQGGPNVWGTVSVLNLPPASFPDPLSLRILSTSFSGDTVLLATEEENRIDRRVEVLVSDVDGDGIRDGRDPCVRDPLNNVAGACRRASDIHPVLDELIAQGDVSSDTHGRRQIITVTFTNTSETAVQNPFFEVTELTGGNVLVNADEGRGRVGATLSPDVGDGVLSPGESMAVTFQIRLRTYDPFQFFVTFHGDPVP
jgi:hypothetical protein